MNIFLRAKHWQLFLLNFAIPMLIQMFMTASIFTSIMHNSDPFVAFNGFKFFPLMMLFFMGTQFAWFWAVGTGLQKFIPVGINTKLGLFKVFLFVPVVYISLICIAVSVMFSGDINYIDNPVPAYMFFAAVVIPLHLFSMFCIFYCIFFVAKTIRTAELQRETTFSDFTGEFFLVWFFFIGVWILQPRVNKLEEGMEGENVTVS